MNLPTVLSTGQKQTNNALFCLEGTEDRTLTAANQLIRDGVAEIILLGNPGEIEERVKKLGLDDVYRATIIDPKNHEKKIFTRTCCLNYAKKRNDT